MILEIKVKLKAENHDSEYELGNIINIFRPYINQDCTIISKVDDKKVSARVMVGDQEVATSTLQVSTNHVKQGLKKTLYMALCQITDQSMPWGVLTGIRPTKVVHHYKKAKYSESSINQILIEDYCISQEKASLMMEIASKEEEVLAKNKDGEISLYIGIPFCPTRCLYCSFTSYSLKEKGKQVDAYLDALFKEIGYVSNMVKGKKIRSLYIGGGTPTSLDVIQLERLLEKVEKCFNIADIEEYTVEAGRPDTLNREKLKIMKKYLVGRISINPQTMNQKTLDIIGRSHRVEDIIDIFHIAREEGHHNINMDLIVGLPGETPADVAYTMEEIIKLKPDSITVHTMAIKRASRLKEEIQEHHLARAEDIQEMLKLTSKGAVDMGMEPYYMYRQKDILGNFENVGYAAPGKESIYNIQMIAEQQTIIAMGAGASTKIVSNNGIDSVKIERVPNVKNLEEYIKRVDEMIHRKQGRFTSLDS